MSFSTACCFQIILFLYEYLAWQVEIKNYTTHGHHRDLFGQNAYFLIIQINSLPHLAAAYVYYHRIKWAMILYMPYLMIFTTGQIFTWWLPYFFEKGLWYMDENGEKLAQYKQYHANHHRILPRFKDHAIIPDTEHTILFVLTSITLLLTIRTTIKSKAVKFKLK
ncbi:unnamed protein product [Rotaria magnacalcarata]|uniref:Uncharacterized protein n=1 Tax=Rotaria magnacalcarata TaxID=392030 RepID=A0A816M2T8_9BILA|nr:unnamed protein product [Rotaria magnacalcarata]CAF3842388.1 unnamed protein product [Rotaria magnacalcarata]